VAGDRGAVNITIYVLRTRDTAIHVNSARQDTGATVG